MVSFTWTRARPLWNSCAAQNETLLKLVREYEKSEAESTWATTQSLNLQFYLRFLLDDIGRVIQRQTIAKFMRSKSWLKAVVLKSFSPPPILHTQAETDTFEEQNPCRLIGYSLRSEKGTRFYYPWWEACHQMQRMYPQITMAEVDLAHLDCDIQENRGGNPLCVEFLHPDDST